jgi:hypothetical protein
MFRGMWISLHLPLLTKNRVCAAQLSKVFATSRTSQKVLRFSSTFRERLSETALGATRKPRREVALASVDTSRGALQYTL